MTPPVPVNIGHYFNRTYRCLEVAPVTDALRSEIGNALDGYDWELLSKTVLSDESNFGGYKQQIRHAADAARYST